MSPISLRPLVREDLATLEAWWEEPEASYLDGGDSAGPSREFRQSFVQGLSAEASGKWSIIELAGGVPAGYILYRTYSDEPSAAEVAIRLSCQYWGRGIAWDAMCQLLQHLFFELGFERAWLTVFVFNQRAIRLYQRIGFEALETFTDEKGLELFKMGLTRTHWLQRNRSTIRA